MIISHQGHCVRSKFCSFAIVLNSTRIEILHAPNVLLFFRIKLNQISWTAGSDHILCATEGASRCGDMEIIAFKNNELKLEGTMQAHSATCDKLSIDNRSCLVSKSTLLILISLNSLISSAPFSSSYRSSVSVYADILNSSLFYHSHDLI